MLLLPRHRSQAPARAPKRLRPPLSCPAREAIVPKPTTSPIALSSSTRAPLTETSTPARCLGARPSRALYILPYLLWQFSSRFPSTPSCGRFLPALRTPPGPAFIHSRARP
ncbi:hypothetical protein BDV93DRAFT_540829 [Ceratobasidium sp. AG-I]|nr:hypothetical protein BDV93DRAFT_540829 [Ceratobasidium sp. AG-I]